MGKRWLLIISALLCFLVSGQKASAQFRTEAFSQNYNDDPNASQEETSAKRDSSFTFSISEFFGGMAHKRTSRMGNNFFGSMVFVGGQQIYNRDYWKLPIIYGGIGAGVGMGIKYNKAYQQSVEAGTPDTKSKQMRNMMFAAAGTVYWASLMDGLLCYETDIDHHPTRAALLSLLVPGLGQCYNGEPWKVPIYWGFLMGSYHYLHDNTVKYNHFRQIYIDASNPDSGYEGRISAETAKYYRDMYREWRDYSILAIAASYLLQVIDANVFAYMRDFEVSEDLSVNLQPTVITPDTQFAYNPYGFGFKLGISF